MHPEPRLGGSLCFEPLRCLFPNDYQNSRWIRNPPQLIPAASTRSGVVIPPIPVLRGSPLTGYLEKLNPNGGEIRLDASVDGSGHGGDDGFDMDSLDDDLEFPPISDSEF